MTFERLENENDFEWKLRLCLAKKRNEIDLDWQEIVDLLGLDITKDQLRKQAVGYYEYDEYIHGYGGVANRILAISDLHVPFQLPKETFKDYVGIVDTLVINGDILDCQAISKFPKLYRISPMEEIITARQYLIDLIEYIQPKTVYMTYGNHDARMGNYFAKNLDTDILELMPNNAIELIVEDGFRHYNKMTKAKTYYEPLADVFERIGIDVIYCNDWKVKIGKTWFVHPLSYRSGILSTASKAKNYLQDTDTEMFDAVIMSHTHKVGETKIGNINLYEQGACCYVDRMSYTDGRMQQPQKEGYMFICQDEEGNLIKAKTKLIELN
jgi:predicted phosphodiesterase